VAIAGDVFTDNYTALANPEDAVHTLQSIKSTYGVYACMGNHDGGSTYGDMVSFLKRGNVHVLEDDYEVVDNKFTIVGRKDSSPIGAQGTPRQDLAIVLEGVDATMPIIVLDHTPSNTNLREYGSEVDLILSGHTHKGQMFPANLITSLVFDVDYGYYQKNPDSPQVIVTSGVGVWGPPFRIGTNNEIASVIMDFE